MNDMFEIGDLLKMDELINDYEFWKKAVVDESFSLSEKKIIWADFY